MADKPVATIWVNSRTINLGGEVLAIQQITRLRTFVDDGRRGFNQLRSIILLAGLLAIVFGGSSSSSTLILLGILAAGGAAAYSLIGTKRYILGIELSSGRATILTSANETAVDELRNAVAEVLESPPTHPTTINVGDVYRVDARGGQGMQFGSNNTQTS